MKLRGELKKAIISSLTGKYAVYIFQLLSLALLARIFTPEEFGFIAAIQVFTLFFQMLATTSLAPAVVFQESFEKENRNGVFTVTIFFGVALACLFTIIAPTIHKWYGFDDGIEVFYLIGLCVLFSSLSMMPLASLQKDAKFLVIARCELLSELLALGLCLLMLDWMGGLYALAIKITAVPTLRFLFYFQASKYTVIGRPSLGKKISAVSELWGFAKYQLGFNVLNYFSRNLDNVLIAKYFGVASLGFYEKTYQVMRYPLQMFTFAITPALQPILTRYRQDPELVSLEYYRVAYRLALVGLFSSLVLFWGAEQVIFILFGQQWLPAAEYLRILAVSIPIQMVLSSTGGVYQAFGATKSMFFCGIFSSIVNVTAILVGISSGDLTVLCLALSISFSINFIQCFWVLHRQVFPPAMDKVLLLCLLVFSGWISLFFKDFAGDIPLTFFSAFSTLVVLSLAAAILCGAIYYFIRQQLVSPDKPTV